MKFEEKLQKLRKASGLSQEQLADKLSVSRQAVSKWESGASYPEMDKLIQMSKIFNCTLDELVNDEETDQTIFKNQASKRNMYLDSFMEFITKSINMFSKMRFKNLIRAVCELIIVACVISLGCLLFYFVIQELLYAIIVKTSTDSILEITYFIFEILDAAVLIVLVIVAIIIFFQVYKIRYLDYYDKLMYEYEQRKELNNEQNEDKQLEKKIKNNKLEKIEEDKKDRIIIRDPEHRPFAFLSVLSGIIINILKGILVIFSIGFIFTLIFAVISLVIVIYLISINKIFVGIFLGVVGIIIFNLVVLDWNFKYIYNLKMNIRVLFIISIGSIILSSVGAGVFIIGLKDFKFLELNSSDFKTIEQNIAYDKEMSTIQFNDNLYSLILVTDDLVTDGIQIRFDFNEDIHRYKIDVRDNNIKLEFDAKIETINEAISLTLNDLSNNELRLYDVYDIPFVELRSNSENIQSIVKKLRDYENVIYVDNDGDGVYHIY